MTTPYEGDDRIRNIFSGKPSEPEPQLAGGVDLAAPDQAAMRSFSAALVREGGGVAMILIALTKNGQVMTNTVIPGGLVQMLGLLEAGKLALEQRVINSGNNQ